MSIQVECSNCNTAYTVDDQFAGRRVKCRSCGNVFLVGGASDLLPGPSEDPFEKAEFEYPTAKPNTSPATKLYNPIETVVAPRGTVEDAPTPPVRPGLHYQNRSDRPHGRSVGADSASPYVLGVYLLGSVAMGIFASIQIYNVQDLKPSMASALVGQLWGMIAVGIVFFFLFVGTLTLLGVWVTSKMMDFELAGSPYIRACGVAALPGVIASACMFIAFPFNLLLFLATIPITFYMVTMVFEVDWGRGAIAFILGGIGWIIGNVITVLLLIAVLGGSILSLRAKVQEEADKDRQENLLARSNASHGATGNADNYQPAPTPPLPDLPRMDRTSLEQFSQLVARYSSADLSKSTREEREPEVAELNARLKQLQSQYHDDPSWPALQQRVADFARVVDALPAAMIDQSAFADIPDNADDWTTGKLSRAKLAPEVSFKQFKLQVPANMKLDLASGEDANEDLVWNGLNGSSQLRIVIRPRKDVKQRRPVIAMKPAIQRAAEEAGLLAYDGSDVTASFGQINSLPFTKIIVNPSSTGEHFTEYVCAFDNYWLIIHLLPAGDVNEAQTLSAAARTLRKIDDGEAKVDPFDAKYLASRLADDSEHAGPMLRAQGAKSEDALTALLAGDDAIVKRRALEILQDIATEKSLPALRTAALDPDQDNATLARTAIRRISPAVAGGDPKMPAGPGDKTPAAPAQTTKPAEMLRLLADLSSDEAARKKGAVDKLAFVAPTARERPAILSKLSGMLRTKDNAVPTADVVAALIQWADASVGPELLPLLNQDADPDLRHAAMRVLGAAKCAQAAPALVRWLKLDSTHTKDALIDMGSAAEPAVVPMLNDPNPTVAMDATDILQRIGTKKSVPELTRVSKGARDPSIRAAALIALDEVNARLAAEKPTPPAK